MSDHPEPVVDESIIVLANLMLLFFFPQFFVLFVSSSTSRIDAPNSAPPHPPCKSHLQQPLCAPHYWVRSGDCSLFHALNWVGRPVESRQAVHKPRQRACRDGTTCAALTLCFEMCAVALPARCRVSRELLKQFSVCSIPMLRRIMFKTMGLPLHGGKQCHL
jgi:hypothetical protein